MAVRLRADARRGDGNRDLIEQRARGPRTLGDDRLGDLAQVRELALVEVAAGPDDDRLLSAVGKRTETLEEAKAVEGRKAEIENHGGDRLFPHRREGLLRVVGAGDTEAAIAQHALGEAK